MNHCLRHYEEAIAGVCRSCNQPFCTRCLVFAFGAKKPPYCVGCALHASGIRNGVRQVAAPPAPAIEPALAGAAAAAPATQDRRMERALRRAERDAVKAATKAARKAARKPQKGLDIGAPPLLDAEAVRATRVPAPSALMTASGHAAGSTHPV
ncbi:hypothetical protein KSP35_16390 [Aquihabitans sp. G128]|uniref:hypothetical protein n=1 Tax=Aquihabitans sp. G128 TaxID=2849779 RepID=UPI001C228565|nr:hypothetical protein [Aquihabitans sp. G128]QXC59939.1 hypothetical protein KSP35_16390 [Aquihabitans sp. G128]